MSRPLIFEVLKTPAKAFGINKSARAVLIQLCDCYNPERNGSEVWPSLATIAELTGMDIKTVRAGRLALEQAGYIKIYIDHGKPDVCRINADVIREVTDPFQNGRAKLSTPLPKQVPE
jgi:replicative superfamily II helicase